MKRPDKKVQFTNQPEKPYFFVDFSRKKHTKGLKSRRLLKCTILTTMSIVQYDGINIPYTSKDCKLYLVDKVYFINHIPLVKTHL